MNGENQIPSQPKKKHHWIVIIVIILFLFLFLKSITPFLSVGTLMMLKDQITGQSQNANSDKQLEEIVNSIQPAAARSYQFSSPSPEALKRTIDCQKMISFQNDLPIVNPICLNLYRTSPQEIDKKAAEGNHDRIILYGENIVWDAPIIKDNAEPRWDLGKAVYDSAKFNDQITILKLLHLYGFSDMSFINSLVPKDKALPLEAFYYRLGSEEEVKKVCNEQQAAGCAFGMWSTIIPQSILGKKMSLPNQKIWRIIDEKNPDYLAFDYNWPENCMTDDVLLHETAHLLLYAERVNNITDALVAIGYFNEHQADAVKIMSTNLVCGSGSVNNFHTKSGEKKTLFEFNSIYPPTRMGSVSPDPKDTCQLGMLNEWNRFMAKGKFEDQFAIFINSLKNWMRQGKTISDDQGLFNFLLQLNPDQYTKVNMQSHNCQF